MCILILLIARHLEAGLVVFLRLLVKHQHFKYHHRES